MSLSRCEEARPSAQPSLGPASLRGPALSSLWAHPPSGPSAQTAPPGSLSATAHLLSSPDRCPGAPCPVSPNTRHSPRQCSGLTSSVQQQLHTGGRSEAVRRAPAPSSSLKGPEMTPWRCPVRTCVCGQTHTQHKTSKGGDVGNQGDV